MSSRRVLSLTVGLTLVPAIADLLVGGRTVPIRYFAADAFYYHTVARNMAGGGLISFDGLYPTNGFHPLWQAALAAVYAGAMQLPWGEVGYFVGVLLACSLLVTFSVWVIGLAVTQSGRALPASFLLLPVGVYSLLLLPYWLTAIDGFGLSRWSQGSPPLPGTLWSYMNGMESGLVLLAFAGLAWVFIRRKQAPIRSAAFVGAFAGALTLARLDHVFIAAMFPAFYLGRVFRQRSREAWTELLACVTTASLPLVAYLAGNVLYAGALLPVSGAAKSTFPVPTIENFGNVVSVLRSPFASVSSVSRAYRAAQLLIPALLAVWTLRGAWRAWTARETTGRPGNVPGDSYAEFLWLAAAGILLLHAYDFLFVRTFAMGHWYVPVSALFASLAVLVPARARTSGAAASPARVGLTGLVVLLTFAVGHRRPDYHWLYNDFYFVEAAQVRAFYGTDVPRVVEHDDGIIGFATRFPTMSGTGLMLDAEAAEAFEAGHLYDLALDRGFDRAASLAYVLPDGAEERSPGDLGLETADARVRLFARSHPGFGYEEEYVSPSGNVFFVRARSAGHQPIR